MKRSGPIKRRTPLRQRERVASRNDGRAAKLHARNFGDESVTVRAMPCLCFAVGHHQMVLRARGSDVLDYMTPCSKSGVQAAHVTARGMGGSKGGRFDLVPLCSAHHSEAGEAETSQRAAFEQRYGLDLRAEADRIALEHSPPLGIRGLADRWAALREPCWFCGAPSVCSAQPRGAGICRSCCDGACKPRQQLETYETDTLLGWVRRRADRCLAVNQEALGEGVVLADFVTTLGLSIELAGELLDAAGWP